MTFTDYYLLDTGGIGIFTPGAGDGDLEETMQVRYHRYQAGGHQGDSRLSARWRSQNWIDSPTAFHMPASVRLVDDIRFLPARLFTPTEFEEN